MYFWIIFSVISKYLLTKYSYKGSSSSYCISRKLKIDIWKPTYYSKIQLYHYNWVKIPVHEGIFFWAQQVAKGKKKTVKHEEFIAQQNHSLCRDFNVLRCTLQSSFLKSYNSIRSSIWCEFLSNITNIQ